MAILEVFPIKSSGHTILDNSSPISERGSMNLIDFNVADDSVNNQIDVAPHRLTSAELDDIVAGIPNGYNDMPVVYDERGVEHVIGKYIKADGSMVSLYQKSISFTRIDVNGSTWATASNALAGMNVDTIISTVLRQSNHSSYYPATGGASSNDFTFLHYRNTIVDIDGAIIQYTKTTD